MGQERLESVLFDRALSEAELARVSEPDCFRDLRLDQVVDTIVQGRAEYRLQPFFWIALDTVEPVERRQQVFRDLERTDVRGPIDEFARGMRAMRRDLHRIGRVPNPQQKQAWFLDGAAVYCRAVLALHEGLARADPRSPGLRELQAYLRDYTSGHAFTSLHDDTRRLIEELGQVRYRLHIDGNRIRVTRHRGETDHGAEVARTFARFQQGPVRTRHPAIPTRLDMNPIEAQVLERVARLHRDTFRRLEDYCERHRDYEDSTIARFDREIQFYLAILEHVRRLRSAGLELTYPTVSGETKALSAERTFDLALALKRVPDGGSVVTNDLLLQGQERILVVTGPNQGGKSTLARTFGQVHHLARLGCPVPGVGVRLSLCDRIFTHFEREEDLRDLVGKLQSDLLRMHEILAQATPRSVVIMNEVFTSTALRDARFLSRRMLLRLVDLDALCVYVTFLDELASLSPQTVSMVATMNAEHPGERTYRVVRRPADGRAYADTIAERHGLSYPRLRDRLRR